MKIGSIFVSKKITLSKDDLRNIKATAEHIADHGALITGRGGSTNITLNKPPPEEVDRLEKLAGMAESSPEKKIFLNFLIDSVNSNNDSFLREAFLDFADPEWNDLSVRQNVSNWGSVLKDFTDLGQIAPGEKNPKIIARRLNIKPEEAEFLSIKQAIFGKWKLELKAAAKKRKAMLDKPLSSHKSLPKMDEIPDIEGK